jgi:hypothetical protein
LIKGDLSEAQAGCTIWKEVSKETFERFVQFAYTGDYSIPDTREWTTIAEPQKEDTDVSKAFESKCEEEKPAEGYDSLDELKIRLPIGKRSKKDKKKSKSAGGGYGGFGGWGTASSEPAPEPEPDSWPGSTSVIRTSRDTYPDSPPPWPFSTDFHSLQCPLLAPRNIHHHACEPAGQFEPDRSYSNVFLSHASLYVLGDYWLIDALRALAIHKLHQVLCIFELDGKNVTDIVDLARYAYEEEGKGGEDGIGRLRGIACQYIALHAPELSVHSVFMDFIAEGGHFARDFVKLAVQRMQ